MSDLERILKILKARLAVPEYVLMEAYLHNRQNAELEKRLEEMAKLLQAERYESYDFCKQIGDLKTKNRQLDAECCMRFNRNEMLANKVIDLEGEVTKNRHLKDQLAHLGNLIEKNVFYAQEIERLKEERTSMKTQRDRFASSYTQLETENIELKNRSIEEKKLRLSHYAELGMLYKRLSERT